MGHFGGQQEGGHAPQNVISKGDYYIMTLRRGGGGCPECDPEAREGFLEAVELLALASDIFRPRTARKLSTRPGQ